MAWFDIAAGLAQGAQQGIDRVQADQVRRKADAFKDAQEKRALAAEARVVEQDVERKIAEFIERSDPNSLDPVEVQKFGGAAQRYIQKTSDGRLVPRESPLKAKKRAYDTMVLDDAPKDLISKQLARDAGDEKTRSQRGAQALFEDKSKFNLLPDGSKRSVLKTLGYANEDIVPYLSEAGQANYRKNTGAGIAGNLNITAAGIAQQAGLARADLAGKYDVHLAKIRSTTSGEAAQRMEFQRLVNTIMANESVSFEEAAQKIADYFAAVPTAAGSQSSRFKVEPE